MNAPPPPRKSWLSAIGTSDKSVYSNAFRARRMAEFLVICDRVLAHAPVCRVLDLGGVAAYWTGLGDVWAGRNLEITLVNKGMAEGVDGIFTSLDGDARDMSRFADSSFDVVHSNSVLEHVGLWSDMRRMANEVRRLAPTYFVQTPNYWFPVEPHMRAPLVHWLPRPLQRRIVMTWSLGFYGRARTVDDAHMILEDSSLIDAAGMRSLFPDARILRERVGPLTKSLIAVRHAPAG